MLVYLAIVFQAAVATNSGFVLVLIVFLFQIVSSFVFPTLSVAFSSLNLFERINNSSRDDFGMIG